MADGNQVTLKTKREGWGWRGWSGPRWKETQESHGGTCWEENGVLPR